MDAFNDYDDDNDNDCHQITLKCNCERIERKFAWLTDRTARNCGRSDGHDVKPLRLSCGRNFCGWRTQYAHRLCTYV